MPDVFVDPPARRHVAALLTVAVLVAGAVAQRGHVFAQSPVVKLTTVLQDLASAVPQDAGGALAQAASVRPLVAGTLPRSVQDSVQSRRARIDDASRVQVYVLMTDVTDETVRQLTAVGATVEIEDRDHRRVQARVPVQRLEAVAGLPFVSFVRLPTYAARHIGGVTSEGDAILRDDIARQQFAVDGTGVRVGVISDGIKGVIATGCTTCGGASGGPIATGDLPAATGVRSSTGVLNSTSGGIAGRSFQANGDLEGRPSGSCAFAGAGAEGTALLEIVHDLAPGAALAFANADTTLAFAQAVTYLDQTNDVVVDDLGFFGEATDGTGYVSFNTASQLNTNANPVRTYVTSVGNESNIHYLGGYVDSGVDGSSIAGLGASGHLHQFQATNDTVDVLGLGAQPYDLIFLPQNGQVVTFLTWNDTYGASTNNYDLFLVSQTTGAVVAKSTDAQSGTQDPVEAFSYTNSSASGYFRILVQNVGNRAAARQLTLFSFQPECAASGPAYLATGRHEKHNYNTVGQSLTAESDAGGSPVSVISVGAICSGTAAAATAFPADESCADPHHATIDFFSSRGPTTDGRQKPDVSAIDGVSITAAGSFQNPFFGTSAAAPHVAGTAALLLQAAPCLRGTDTHAIDPVAARTRLRSLIIANAVNVSGTAPDNTFGAGLVDGFASISHTLPSFAGASSITVGANVPSGASVTASQLGFTDPNGCALTGLSWSGGCGSSPNPTMTCAPGTSNVSVAATNNGVSYSLPATVRIVVTSYSIDAAPLVRTVNAGQSATYQVTVTPQGGTFPSAVTFSCGNLPAQTSCSFSPASATPGSGPVQTTLTIVTTSRSGAWPTPRWPFPRPVVPVALVALVFAVALCAIGARVLGRSAVAVGVTTMAIVTIVATGCGGSSGSKSTPSTTASAAVSPSSLAFSSTVVGSSSAAQTVTLSNGGSAALTISGISASGDFSQTNTCGGSLAAGATCTISVVFAPAAAGARTGTLTINDNAASSPQTVSLSGTADAKGTAPGSYQVSVVASSGTFTQSTAVTVNVQ